MLGAWCQNRPGHDLCTTVCRPVLEGDPEVLPQPEVNGYFGASGPRDPVPNHCRLPRAPLQDQWYVSYVNKKLKVKG